MIVNAIKTETYIPNTDLVEFIWTHAKQHLKEKSILALTSKIFSLYEGRTIPKNSKDRIELIRSESDHFLGEIGHNNYLGIKNSLLAPSAGIDSSNSPNDEYILMPENPFLSCSKVHKKLSQKLGFSNWGLIMTDSKSRPLRRGSTGVSIGYWGFKGLKNLVGKSDLYGKSLLSSVQNRVDALAAAAVLVMGESDEGCPLAIVYDFEVSFIDGADNNDAYLNESTDIYSPLYKHLIR